MESRPSPPFPPHHDEPIDPDQVDRAWQVLRSAALRLDRIAAEEGWPIPFAPVRYLILVLLQRATAFGLTVRRIALSLAVRPSSLAHHLDVLEETGLVYRTSKVLHDRRKVIVRLTDEGRYALALFGPSALLERPRDKFNDLAGDPFTCD